MIGSFTYPSQENAGGIKKLLFVPTYNVAGYPDVINNKAQSAIVLAVGINWLTGYFTKNQGVGESADDLSVAGLVYANSLTGRMPKVTDTITALFTEMSNTPFLVLETDGNNQKLLYGSIDSPMFFRFGHTTNAKIKQGTAYNFEFYNNADKPGVIYNF